MALWQWWRTSAWQNTIVPATKYLSKRRLHYLTLPRTNGPAFFNKQVNKFCRPYWPFGILFMGLPKAKYVVYHIHVPVHTCFRSKKKRVNVLILFGLCRLTCCFYNIPINILLPVIITAHCYFLTVLHCTNTLTYLLTHLIFDTTSYVCLYYTQSRIEFHTSTPHLVMFLHHPITNIWQKLCYEHLKCVACLFELMDDYEVGYLKLGFDSIILMLCG